MPIGCMPARRTSSGTNTTNSPCRTFPRQPYFMKMSASDYITLPIPAPPNTQALSSTTFTLPPLDGSLTLPEIWDFHYEHSPNHPRFVYADDSSSTHTIFWAQTVRAMHQAGRIVRSRLAVDEVAPPSGRPIIAILALSGMFFSKP